MALERLRQAGNLSAHRRLRGDDHLAAGLGEFDRVRHQIEDDLLDGAAVGNPVAICTRSVWAVRRSAERAREARNTA